MLQTWWRRAVRAPVGRVYLGWKGRRTVLGLALLCAVPACKNANLFTIENDRQLGEDTYPQVLAGETLIVSGAIHRSVNELMDKLVAAAREEHPEIVDAFDWEVQVIDDDGTVNAFAMPGGKMAVYTGILSVAASVGDAEAGLAVVMGHEIAHVIERHGTEAMTRMYGMEVLLAILLEEDDQALGNLGANLLTLKFGRGAELEADAMGLRLMARAGYDPRNAVKFWSEMAELSGGAGQPEFLSTHPSHACGISQIQSMLPEVLPIYEANKANNP